MRDASEPYAGAHGRLVEAGAGEIGLALVDVGMACRVVLGIVFQKATDLTRRSLSEMSSEGRTDSGHRHRSHLGPDPPKPRRGRLRQRVSVS